MIHTAAKNKAARQMQRQLIDIAATTRSYALREMRESDADTIRSHVNAIMQILSKY